MATPAKTSAPACRYFLLGRCWKGADCFYSHAAQAASTSTSSASASASASQSQSASPAKANEKGGKGKADNASSSSSSQTVTVVCAFYLKGNCSFGEKCRYRHSDTGKPVPAAQNMPPTKSSSSKASGSATASAVAPPPPRSLSVEPLVSRMQELGVDKKKKNRSWADAPEFVPRSAAAAEAPKSWAHVVNPVAMAEMSVSEAEAELCPFGFNGECKYGEECQYLHGEVCDLCQRAALHPTHQEQRSQHQFICLRQHEHDMEVAFAYARSKEKTCGICMEVVVDKQPKSEARFGIMPNCTHCFCLNCLRQWRQAMSFESKVVKACPECRQTSDYICPSQYWVDTDEEKAALLGDYKANQAAKDCKYFQRGDAECPFGNRCFYRHATKDGKEVDVGPPPRRPQRQDDSGELTLVSRILINDFLEERDARGAGSLFAVPPEYLDLLGLLSDDGDSEHEY